MSSSPSGLTFALEKWFDLNSTVLFYRNESMPKPKLRCALIFLTTTKSTISSLMPVSKLETVSDDVLQASAKAEIFTVTNFSSSNG